MSLSYLQKLGITPTEANLYEILLKLGEIPITRLVSESKIKRPTVYKAVETLEKKGLVKTADIKKKIHVRPESPSRLTELADKESESLKEARENLLASLPALSLHYTHSTDRPVVKTYEGVDGLKLLYESILSEQKPIYALLQASEVDPELYAWLTTRYTRKRVRGKIHVKAIVASSSQSKEYVQRSKEEFRLSRMVDNKLYPFQHEIDIYGDKVAIINYKKDEPLIGIVIHHPRIAATMKAWFDLAWMGCFSKID